MLKYFRRKQKRKLYQQWVEKANLSPDAIPREETAEDMITMSQADKQQSHLTVLYILLGVAVALLGAGLTFLIVYSFDVVTESEPTSEPTSELTSEPILTTPEIAVTAVTLYSDYLVNSVAADQKYKDKLLQVTGTVTKIDTDILGNPTVMFGMDSYNVSGVLATFKKSELNNIVNISLGQTIIIIGTGNRKLNWILLDDCSMKN